MRWAWIAAGIFAAALAGCGTSDDDAGTPANGGDPASTETSVPGDGGDGADDATEEPTNTPAPEGPGARFASTWPDTDFSNATVDLDEVRSGGVPRDGIPPLDAEGATSVESSQAGVATFIPASEAGYEPQMPVIVVSEGGETKGYPLHILTWHEVANDVVGGRPVAVTFCPLCNTAIVFDREVDGDVLDFGVSGMLRHSDLIMWDRQTESWWQQLSGEGIAGEHAGTQLEFVTAPTVNFAEFREQHPDALVLSEDTGISRNYGTNPYGGYDESPRPFLFDGEVDDRLPALARVLALPHDDEPVAVPYSVLQETAVANVEREAGPVAVFWAPGQVTAMGDTDIANAADVGNAIAFDPVVDGEALTFTSPEEGVFVDDQTGSEWDISGMATRGPLEGTQLETVNHHVPFWFAWSSFNSEAVLWEG